MATKLHIFTEFTMASTPTSSFSASSSTSLSMVRRPLTNGGVGALKVEVIRVASSCKRHLSRQRGGALRARMNLFDRFSRVVKSYANAIISSFGDPEKILEQAILEMNIDLTKTRQATAQVLSSQKRLENKCKAAQQASEDWYRKAQLALQKGEEDLARGALKRRKSFEDNANSMRTQLDQQKSVVDIIVANTKLLESKIQDARSKKDTLKARAQSAKTAVKVSEMVGNVNTSSALSTFDKIEEKVLAMESQAEALGQLTTDDLEGKKGYLPPGRTITPRSNKACPFKDSEIEMSLKEMRREAQDFIRSKEYSQCIREAQNFIRSKEYSQWIREAQDFIRSKEVLSIETGSTGLHTKQCVCTMDTRNTGEKAGKSIQLLSTFLGGFVIAFLKGWLLTLVLLLCIPALGISGGLMSIIV
ncbi:PREDICTED: membrane-associated 30 kDa protein, chloroplastic-like [Fragaria vesca subsp. vesca]